MWYSIAAAVLSAFVGVLFGFQLGAVVGWNEFRRASTVAWLESKGIKSYLEKPWYVTWFLW